MKRGYAYPQRTGYSWTVDLFQEDHIPGAEVSFSVLGLPVVWCEHKFQRTGST